MWDGLPGTAKKAGKIHRSQLWCPERQDGPSGRLFLSVCSGLGERAHRAYGLRLPGHLLDEGVQKG